MMDDPYQILGVSRDASDEEIKRAYRRLAKKYHPDVNPGDEAAAKKMQQINTAYEQIKNPDKGYAAGGGYDPFGGYSGEYQRQSGGQQYRQAAWRYLQFGRYREAINILSNDQNRDAQWYYISALANNGMGNQVTALEHIRRAVSMAPDNMEYLRALHEIESGGTAYRRHANDFGGFTTRGGSLWNLCLCFILQMFCCRGRFFCC